MTRQQTLHGCHSCPNQCNFPNSKIYLGVRIITIPDMSQNMKFTVLSFSNQPGLPKGEIYYIASLSQTAKGGSSDVVQECYEAKTRYHCYCFHFELKKSPFLGIFQKWLLFIES